MKIILDSSEIYEALQQATEEKIGHIHKLDTDNCSLIVIGADKKEVEFDEVAFACEI